MKTALALAALLSSATAAPYESPRACLEDVDGLVETLSPKGVEVTIEYRVCGQVNAGYLANGHRMLVCTELLDEPPAFIHAVLAHEMAHAVIDQYHIPIPGSEEAAADELGALTLIMTGRVDDVKAASNWYTDNPDDGEDVTDDHQSNAKRAAVLGCLAAGASVSVDETCTDRFHHALVTWVRLLETFGPK